MPGQSARFDPEPCAVVIAIMNDRRVAWIETM